VRKVLQIDFTATWERGGCLPHITRAWTCHARNYQHNFASWAGAGYRGEIEGRPHFGFEENRHANRIYNKILRLNKCCFFSLYPIIENLRPDILHIHNRHDLVDQVMARLSYRPKVVCIYHQCYNKLSIPQSADLLLGVGKFVAAWIDRRAAGPRQPIAVLHNPYRQVPAAPRRAEQGKPLFLNYANIRRGTKDFFDAVEMLQREGFDFEARVVGHLYSDLKPPPGVTVSGFIPQPEFLDVAARAAAYICTSYATPFSVAVVEAIARDTPVLCPWDIGAVDLLPPDSYLGFESFSANAMAGAMRAFLQMSGEERRALAARARAAAEIVYNEVTLTQKLENLYDSLFVPA
jgi:glycosyltransferase involved in cell wall biosynthesis